MQGNGSAEPGWRCKAVRSQLTYAAASRNSKDGGVAQLSGCAVAALLSIWLMACCTLQV